MSVEQNGRTERPNGRYRSIVEPRDAGADGRELAARHVDPAPPDREASLLNYAERSRAGDWSMRSALTRFAQPHPERAARVLTLVRRLDAVLHQAMRQLEQHTVVCDRRLSSERIGPEPREAYPDTRVADLARLARSAPEAFAEMLAGYEGASAEPLEAAERVALPLLAVALDLDELADTLAEWAARGPEHPPVEEVDATCAQVQRRLDELDVPEEGPPPDRRGRRDRGV